MKDKNYWGEDSSRNEVKEKTKNTKAAIILFNNEIVHFLLYFFFFRFSLSVFLTNRTYRMWLFVMATCGCPTCTQCCSVEMFISVLVFLFSIRFTSYIWILFIFFVSIPVKKMLHLLFSNGKNPKNQQYR